MPIITQKFIFRSDLQGNPDVMYLFGDNCVRKGLGGQAKEMRGEPNAIGVATKKTPSNNPGEFFTDDDFDSNCAVILNDLEAAVTHLSEGGLLVIPEDGLGTGLSELPKRAPRTNAFLEDEIDNLYAIVDQS